MNANELYELVKIGEGYTLEFKENLDKSMGKEICAFANASGGKIILGVTDKNEINGFTLTNKTTSQIQDIARNMDPSFRVTVEQIENIAVVYVPEGKDNPYQVTGEFYLRNGATSQKLKRDEVREIFQKENHIKFDRKSNSEFDLKKDFDETKFSFFCERANIPKSLSKTHILKNLSLLTDSTPNNACALLFPHRISKFFTNAVISCVLYSGTERIEILDKKEFDADFISNFDNAVIFVMRNTRTGAIIKGRERIETPEIQEEALREAIINAMVHRDYFSEGRVQIDIFLDRVEVSNPGNLLFDKKDLGAVSVSRNPILTDCMHRLRYVEKVGSGINRMKSLVPKTAFKISSNWFRVIFPRDVIYDGVNDGVNEIQKAILREVKKNPQITQSALAEILDKGLRTIERNMTKLQQEGFLRRVGSDKTGHWEILKS